MSDHVRSFGPLWTHSCFEFEAANIKLMKKVHGRTHVEKQVISMINAYLTAMLMQVV